MPSRSIAFVGFGLFTFLMACAGPEESYARYGDVLSLTETTSVSAILADPELYLGQRLRVEGTIVGSCKKRGHWIGVAGEGEGEEIRIWAREGLAFPVDALGLHANAEGVWEKVELTMEQTLAHAQHQAEEHGGEFDPSTITGPSILYQILASGAEIEVAR